MRAVAVSLYDVVLLVPVNTDKDSENSTILVSVAFYASISDVFFSEDQSCLHQC